MLVTMLVTRIATEDGIRLRQYDAGKIYNVRENLAWRFRAMGHAFWLNQESAPSFAGEGI